MENKEQLNVRPVSVAGLFNDKQKATKFVEKLIDEDFPMDQLSLLHKGGGHGDDPLGVVYTNNKERIKVWGEQGVLWGALGGLLVGLSGIFLVPGFGSILAAGPVVEAMLGAITGGTAMAGAAAVTSITTAFRRLQIPEEYLKELETAIQNGQYLLLLHSDAIHSERLAQRLGYEGAQSIFQF